VRLNAALTKHLLAAEVKYVQIGVEGDALLVKPMVEKKDSFKLIVNKNSGQICSTTIGEWAAERGLLKQRASGVWNSQRNLYVFTLANEQMDSQAANQNG
jgi:virulence-associated protein VagC